MFLSGEQRASKGFMTQANTQMELLYNMSEAGPVAKCLCDPTLAKRTAAAMVGFLDALCGPSASQLKVKDMDKYAFDPKRLLVQITTIVLRVWKQDHPRVSNGGGSPLSTPSPAGGGTTMGKDSFTVSLSNHPDYSQSTMTKCASVLQKQMLGDPALLADFTDFIKQDEDHLDLVRVLITGPTGTPYGRGCFVFDIFYPVSYPTNPPLVVMTTTGGGTVRFNPNLYADGKVCLSLLGTWHGGDATEKWDPLRSNLLQVLLSIQDMIFIPDPMFNEPCYEAIRGSDEGNAQSRKYNADIEVYTLRYAMVEQLRNPPKGFEDIIQVHFAIQREAIMKQLSQWVKEVISPEHERKLRKAIDDFRAELDKL